MNILVNLQIFRFWTWKYNFVVRGFMHGTRNIWCPFLFICLAQKIKKIGAEIGTRFWNVSNKRYPRHFQQSSQALTTGYPIHFLCIQMSTTCKVTDITITNTIRMQSYAHLLELGGTYFRVNMFSISELTLKGRKRMKLFFNCMNSRFCILPTKIGRSSFTHVFTITYNKCNRLKCKCMYRSV